MMFVNETFLNIMLKFEFLIII